MGRQTRRVEIQGTGVGAGHFIGPSAGISLTLSIRREPVPLKDLVIRGVGQEIGRRQHAASTALWISLGNFIAEIRTTYSPGDGRQGLAIAATYLIAQQSSDHCAYADANRAILCSRCWWLVHRRPGIPLAGLRLCVLDRMVMHDSFLHCALIAGCPGSCDLVNRYRYWCDSGSLCGNRHGLRSAGMRIR